MRMFPLSKNMIKHMSVALFGLWLPVVAAQPEAQVIVKLRSNVSISMKQALAADRTTAMTRIAGVKVRAGAELAPGMQVWRASGLSSEALAAKLAQQADVEYAQPDRLKKIRAVPNDALFGLQWYLQNTQVASINALAAWDLIHGSPSVTVAVIDTGIRPSHPDLANKLLPGFDFVSGLSEAADGDGWDSDPSDPGDGLTTQDLATAELAGCGGGADGSQPQNSSWHGTKVSGIAAAQGNNATGISGVGWDLKILPVRALGKCGGRDSDIIAAMRWAAGLSVAGAPLNPNPAKILNLSLGGQTDCSRAYRDAIAEITAAGSLVVAAAGNSTGPVEEPGNCPGVLAVAGVRHEGNKVGYSSYGREVGISAPAGNCVNETGACLFPFYTTSNDGQFTPHNDIYTGQANEITVGTSFATPLVAGVAGLMLSAHPDLTPAQLIGRMKNGAKAFVFDSSLPTCPVVVSDTSSQAGQCNCTSTTCGAGLLNALGAVNEALRPIARFAVTGDLMAGRTLSLNAASVSPASGHVISKYQWSALFSDGTPVSVLAADQQQASLVPQRSGSLTLSLVVTDDAGKVDASSQVLSIAADTSVGTGGGTGSGSGGSSGSGTGGTTTTPTDPVTTTPVAQGGGGGGGGGALDLASLLGLLTLLGLAYLPRRV